MGVKSFEIAAREKHDAFETSARGAVEDERHQELRRKPEIGLLRYDQKASKVHRLDVPKSVVQRRPNGAKSAFELLYATSCHFGHDGHCRLRQVTPPCDGSGTMHPPVGKSI